MAINHGDDDKYIDMELSSNAISNREFEFQMSSVSMEKEPTNSPADDLFYKGKLLPLHLPPRLEMVRKLLQNSINEGEVHTDTISPFESRSIPFPPCQSCRVSGELNLEVEEEHSTDVNGGNGEIHPKRSLVKRLRMMKQSSIGSKLKAYSRVYLRSLFGNKATKKTPVAVEHSNSRTSFSMPIKRNSSPSSKHLQFLKRSNSVNAEMESPIQGAIAHCKQSQGQQWIRSRKTMSEVGFYSFSVEQLRPHIFRG